MLCLCPHFLTTSLPSSTPAADEHMLRHLVILNLRDCVNLTDKGVQGLAERSRKIQTLILRGCDKITDKALVHLSTAYEFTFQLCDALRILDVSYCSGITASGILDLLPLCGVLEELRVSGLVSVNDAFALSLCRVCKTVQRLIAQKCVFLTDAALCCLAEHMWVEELDVSVRSVLTTHCDDQPYPFYPPTPTQRAAIVSPMMASKC